MSNNPFEPSKSEISARKVAKFLIELPTNEIPGFVGQVPPPHLARVVASMESYTIRASLISAYVRAIVAGHSLSQASGEAAKVSRAVRRALHAIPDSHTTSIPLAPSPPGKKK